ncbi:MAG: SulP family inorganic anion transporter [Singulisphaera sp.]
MSENILTAIIPDAKPRNGLAGLAYWRHDLVAGLMVSLTSLPLSLGIAVASGAPPIAGLMSAIIAGLLFPFLGGAYVTISGPAAGLAPALLAAMIALGHGHLETGYPRLLAVICMVGAIQIVLSWLGAAKLSAAFPVSVVEGMLASIGLLIVTKELPHFIGHDFKSHAFFGILQEVPEEIRLLDPKSFGVGIVCLILLFVLSMKKIQQRLAVPPPLVVVGVGMILGGALGVDAHHLIKIPDDILTHGIVLPDFRSLFSDRSIAWAIVTGVVTLVLIDGVESLATIKAIDKIDPFKRKSSPGRTLMAMGVSNICSSVAGGLTIIPGGVKSKLCIVSGGRTLWANFYNALFLVAYLFAGKGLINLIPYSALAAILIYTGYKMFEPKIWLHVLHIGPEQFFVFSVTVATTLATDLLIGIFTGMVVELLLSMALTSHHVRTPLDRPMTFREVFPYALAHLSQFLRNPVMRREQRADGYHVYLDRPLVCFNSLHLDRELSSIPDDAANVYLHIGSHVMIIDHTSCDSLMQFAEEYESSRRGRVELVGMDRLVGWSHSNNGARLAPVSANGHAQPVAIPEDSLADVRAVD